jgi:hypothetical protein
MLIHIQRRDFIMLFGGVALRHYEGVLQAADGHDCVLMDPN